MDLVNCGFDLLFSELKNVALSDQFLFFFNYFEESKDLIRFNQVILKLDVENLKLEIFFGWFFYFTMDFHDFFILNVVFLKLFYLDFRAH